MLVNKFTSLAFSSSNIRTNKLDELADQLNTMQGALNVYIAQILKGENLETTSQTDIPIKELQKIKKQIKKDKKILQEEIQLFEDTKNGMIELNTVLLQQQQRKTNIKQLKANIESLESEIKSLTEKEMHDIAQIAIENDLWVLSDEAYFEIIYEGDAKSIVSIPGMKERTVILYTFSKKFAMTGWRVGGSIGPKDIIKRIAKFNVNAESCTTHFIQNAMVEALNGDQSGSIEILKILKMSMN